MKVYEPSHLEGAPEGFRSKDFRAKELPGHKLTIQVSPDDCTGCGVCVNVCPARSNARGATQGHRHGAGGGAPCRGARELGVLRRDPDTRQGPDAARLGPRLTGAGASLRVLRRLRRVRRDALRQARLAAVRRPDRGRQRHRLLVHLRRQPADDPLDRRSQRAWAGVEQLPVRGRRRVRDGHAPGLQGAAPQGKAAPRACRPKARRGSRAGDPDGAPGEGGRRSARNANAWPTS